MNLLSHALTRPDFDLRGTHLVSASAGTGKTYSIQSLYLRLLLTHGLTVRQVLVVTFTEAATRELRDRLRRVLLEAARYLDDLPGPHEPRIVETVALVPPEARGAARRALRQALVDFDLASIHTIHGFCLRALSRFAFETGQAFDAEPAADTGSELQRLCEDWWRRNAYPATPALAALLAHAELTLATLSSLARKRIAKPDALLKPEPLGLADLPRRLAALLEPLRTRDVPPAPTPTAPALSPQATPEVILAGLDACREALARNDWTAAAAALLAARKHTTTVAPWPLPAELEPWLAACSSLVAATKGKQARTFRIEEGRLRGNASPSPEFERADETLRRTGEALLTPFVEQLTRAPHAWPRRTTQAAEAAFTGLGTLRDYARNVPGLTGDRVVDAARAVEKGIRQLPEARTLSLGTLAPDWEAVAADIVALLPSLLPGAVEAVAAEYRAGRPGRTAISFDDYLLNLREALEGPHAAELKKALREEYRAALIDEFQDTDPVQYGIFRALFRDGGEGRLPPGTAPCFLVGDPKQAIYRFRNGDIETYRTATATLADDQRHALNRNFRSEARLITAVNQLFGDRPRGECAHTFRLPEMAYDGSLEAQGKLKEKSLTIAGELDPMPLKLWYFDEPQKRVPGIDSPLARSVYAQTAGEIRRLLDDERTRIAGARVRPGQVAVLVMRHQEAEAIEAELAVRGVPSVRQGASSVFDAPEALEFWIVVAALAEPRDVRRVRAALVSELLGLSYGDLAALNDGQVRALPEHWQPADEDPVGRALEHWVAFFERLHTLWRRTGFAAAFQSLAALSGLRARTAARPRGERSLTNVLQLAELLHGAAVSGRLTLEGTVAWLQRQLDPDARKADEAQELRLDTDDDAVRILTVFKSKGLEFPIVFVPTLFLRQAQAKRRSSHELEYHDPEGRLVIETGTEVGSEAALRECFEEDIRLAYVATTRAVHRTVLVWANLPVPEEQHALAWLFGPGAPQDALHARFGDGLALSVERRELAFDDDAAPFRPDDGRPPPPLSLPPAPCVERRFGHGSFSALAPHAEEPVEGAAPHGAGAEPASDLDAATDLPVLEDAAVAEANPLFDFPAGAKTGTCWHAVFEELPFDATDGLIRTTAGEQLERFGLFHEVPSAERDRRLAATVQMVRRVLDNPLPSTEPGTEAFRLRDVGARDRRTEWEFSFPAAAWTASEPVRTSAVAAALRRAWRHNPERAGFLQRLEGWDRPLPGGYLTGFVDLLFRHRNRFYIVDWKSNRRGGKAADFDAAGIREEMALHAYFLQYLFYTVAVHQYLKGALADYAYARHFGGVHYLFLRGIDGQTDRGIFTDRPSEALVEELSVLLGRFA